MISKLAKLWEICCKLERGLNSSLFYVTLLFKSAVLIPGRRRNVLYIWYNYPYNIFIDYFSLYNLTFGYNYYFCGNKSQIINLMLWKRTELMKF